MLCSSLQGSSVSTSSLDSAAQANARLSPADSGYPTFTALIDADISPLHIRLKSMRFPASPLALGCTALPTCTTAATHTDLTLYCSWMEPSILHSSMRCGAPQNMCVWAWLRGSGVASATVCTMSRSRPRMLVALQLCSACHTVTACAGSDKAGMMSSVVCAAVLTLWCRGCTASSCCRQQMKSPN